MMTICFLWPRLHIPDVDFTNFNSLLSAKWVFYSSMKSLKKEKEVDKIEYL